MGNFFLVEMFILIIDGVRKRGEGVGIVGDKNGCVQLRGKVLSGGMVKIKLILVWSDKTLKRSGV